MMTSSPIQIIISVLIVWSCAFSSEEALWDLGVIINYQKNNTYQQELNLDELYLHTKNNENKIKALYSHNFIAPILYEIKNPVDNNFNIMETYDQMIANLSITEKANMLKSAFLNKTYWKFFSLHSFFKNKPENTTQFNEMYIQQLYSAKKFNEAQRFLDVTEKQDLTDILLYYKIKLLVRQKSIKEAQQHIDFFISKHHNSDLLYYVKHEKKLIEIKYEK